MADAIIECPHCGQQMTVQEEWAGMVLECPNCKNSLTCPEFSAPPAASEPPAPPEPPAHQKLSLPSSASAGSAQGSSFSPHSPRYEQNNAPKKPSAFGKFLRKAGSIAFFAAIGLGAALFQSHQKEQSIRDEIKKFFASGDFIYAGAQVTDIRKQKDGLYMVTFHRDGRSYQRPIRYREQSGSYEVRLDFKYADRQDYLVEDAGLFWEKLKKLDARLSSYRLTDVKACSTGTLCCTLTDGRETVKADLRVSERPVSSFNPLNRNDTQIEYSLAPVTSIQELFASGDFLYCGARVTEIRMQKDENSFMVTFLRNGKAYRRPVRFREAFNWNLDLNDGPGGRKSSQPKEGRYELDFKYADHQDYLLEDADMFWENIKKSNPDLASCRLTGVEPRSAGVVRLTVTDGKETAKGDLHVTEKPASGGLLNQGGTRIEYQLKPVE